MLEDAYEPSNLRRVGQAYQAFGIGAEGALVVVRPDGYVGIVATLDEVQSVGAYFAGCLTQIVS